MSTLPLFDDPQKQGAGGQGKPPDNGDTTKVYRVSQLNRAVRGLLEQRWGSVWVHGEISDFTLAASGHAYFTLNDEDEPAQLRVVLFRSDVQRSKARLENGARVRLQGQLSLFTPRGSYQMIARIALPEGLGELHAQFERVRKKLEAEGLLAPERKRALPHLPRVLGVVTSPHGAALHDIVRVVQARSPTRIVISPCVVQGSSAPASILRALRRIQKLQGLDAIIIGRGGGAAEDLVAFNDERVARAIAACRVPVISAVGHEVDISIADLVADVRAATPSNAAELAVPDRRALLSELQGAQRRLARAAEIYLGRARLRIAYSSRRLRDPRQVLRHTRGRLNTLTQQLHTRLRARVRDQRAQLKQQDTRLAKTDPRQALRRIRALLKTSEQRLHTRLRARAREQRAAYVQLNQRLAKSDPRTTLRRIRALLTASEQRLHTRLRARVREQRGGIVQLSNRLAKNDPRQAVRRGRTLVLGFEQRLHTLLRGRLREQRAELVLLNARLAKRDPRQVLRQSRARLHSLEQQLHARMRARLRAEHAALVAQRQRLSQLQTRLWAMGRALSHPHKQLLARFAGQLMALSPLASLARGYAIVLHEPSGRALHRASDARAGDGLQIRLHEGTLRARVENS